MSEKSIWFSHQSISSVQHLIRKNMLEHLGIEMLEIGDDYMLARMPVDHRTVQPMGILHGGASVALAESLGSIGSYLTVDQAKYHCVGIEVNANHLKSVSHGFVYAKAVPVRLGRKIQVWTIEIKDDDGHIICLSRLTMAVLEVKSK